LLKKKIVLPLLEEKIMTKEIFSIESTVSHRKK